MNKQLLLLFWQYFWNAVSLRYNTKRTIFFASQVLFIADEVQTGLGRTGKYVLTICFETFYPMMIPICLTQGQSFKWGQQLLLTGWHIFCRIFVLSHWYFIFSSRILS